MKTIIDLKYYKFIVIFLLSSIACKNKNPKGSIPFDINISQNERNGVKEVTEFYKGKCVYSIGMFSSTSSGTVNYFELEISDSPEIDDQRDIPKLPASNIAYLFFKNLKEEKGKYNEIHSTIILADGVKYSYSYNMDTLQLVYDKMRIADKVVELIKERKYDQIKTILVPDSSFYLIDEDIYIADMASIDSEYGDVKKFEPWGFRFQKLKTGRELLHISGSIERASKNHQFSIDVDADPKNNEVVHIRYKI